MELIQDSWSIFGSDDQAVDNTLRVIKTDSFIWTSLRIMDLKDVIIVVSKFSDITFVSFRIVCNSCLSLLYLSLNLINTLRMHGRLEGVICLCVKLCGIKSSFLSLVLHKAFLKLFWSFIGNLLIALVSRYL
jgi:hypothetical protein